MDMEDKVTLSTFLLLCLFSIVLGYSSFRHQIPNGNRVYHPCDKRKEWATVGHVTSNQMNPGARNLFGQDWKNNGFNWKAVCPLDSDLDGLTNGEELGDPNCVWEFGQVPTGPVRGHPGFCDDTREQCSEDSFAILRSCRDKMKLKKRVKPTGGRPQRQPRLPPTEGMDHPQTHLTKRGRQLSLTGLPSFGQSGLSQSRFFQPPRVQEQFPGHAQRFIGAAPQFPGAAPQFPGAAPHFPGVAPRFPGAIPQFPGLAPQMSGHLPQMTGGSQGFPGVPPTTGVHRRFPGFERFEGLTIYGTRPGQGHVTHTGSRTFPTHTSSREAASRVFPTGRSPTFPFFGASRMTPVGSSSGVSQRFPMGSRSADTPMYPGVTGVVAGAGQSGMRAGIGSYQGRTMMGTGVHTGMRF